MENNFEKQFVVGVDIGGQTSKIGVVNTRGEVLAQIVIRSDIYGSDADAFILALSNAIKTCIKEAGVEGQVRGIGVGAPNGNYYTGCVAFAPNLAWAAGQSVELAAKLSAQMDGIPVSLTNDANAAAVGEMTYGAARGLKDFIMITLGTGVGSGIVIDGKVVYGHDGFAGELGHVCVVRNGGRLCGCGKTGCLETYCSLDRLEQAAGTDTENFFFRLRNGDRQSKEIWLTYMDNLSLAIRNMMVILDCDIVLSLSLIHI